jgi:hypothetical protein
MMMPNEPTVTTVDLAKEVGLTGRSIRLAIHRGDLQATRISKGLGRTASATEFVIKRKDADDWKARRAERKRGVPYPAVLEGQKQRRDSNHHAYLEAKDSGDSYKDAVERWKREALAGNEQARQQLRLPWEQGGLALARWWRAGVGDIV